MKRLAIALGMFAVLASVGWLVMQRLATEPPDGTLYGNVEIRQVDLAFNSEGTVTTLQKQEGDTVKVGEVIATLDDATYQSAKALAEGRLAGAQAQLDKLVHGTRPEDIDQARANVANSKAVLANAQVSFSRQQGLAVTNATTRQLVDDARRGLNSSRGATGANARGAGRGGQWATGRGYRRRSRPSASIRSVAGSGEHPVGPDDAEVALRRDCHDPCH